MDSTPQKQKGSFAAKFKIWLFGVAMGAVLSTVGFVFLQHYRPPQPTQLQPSVVFERVVEQNELVSASQRYNITEKSKDKGKVIPFTDIAIPLTDNSFWYRFVGTIKASVNLQTAKFKLKGNTITVTLDQPTISSNTPDMKESHVLEENNNVFNPIDIEQVDKFREKCVETSEQQAIKGGLFDEARENAEANITNMFVAAFGDQYEIEFRWNE